MTTTPLVFAVQSPVQDPPVGAPPGPTWKANLSAAIELAEAAARRHGNPDLVVLPAYVVTGIPASLDGADLAAALPTIPCPDAMQLAALAQRWRCWLVSSALEYDPATPNAWYITAFLLDPAGEVVLKYRKVKPPTLGVLAGATSPLEYEADPARLFPVLDTPIGRIGLCIGMDALSPELGRALLFNGAEIVCHVTDEPATAWRAGALNARRAREWESGSWWISADSAAGGTSEIIGLDARPVATASGPGATVVVGRLDLEASRGARAMPRATNFPLMLRTPLFVPGFARAAQEGIPQHTEPLAPYSVACLQPKMYHDPDLRKRDVWVNQNLDRTIELFDWCGQTAKIVVCPEFWLQGYERGFGFEDFFELAIEVDGWEFEKLGAAMRRFPGFYFAGSIFEKDRDWPGRIFNTSFILDPQGQLVARYRKITCLNLAGALADTTPGDIYSAYIAHYPEGADALFPVVDTPYGRLATMSSFEIHYPEQVRQLALRGAEVILHTTAEVNGFQRHAWQHARQARAFDNLVYLLSSNNASDHAPGTPINLHHGHSQIIDFNGQILSTMDQGGEAVLSSQIDVGALRRRRAQEPNWFRGQPWATWERVYRDNQACPIDLFLDEPFTDKTKGPPIMKSNLEGLYERGIYVRPGTTWAAPANANQSTR